MTAPVLTAVDPGIVGTTGGELLRLTGENFTSEIDISFDDERPHRVRSSDGTSADVHAPAHAAGGVDVQIQNIADDGAPVPGEVFTLPDALVFVRASLADPSNLVRLARAVVQRFKRDVLDNTVLTVSVDYRDDTGQTLRAVPLAKLPSLVLTGPTLRPSPSYRDNTPIDQRGDAPSGAELRRRRRRRTKDIDFSLTGASESTQELINVMSAVEDSLLDDPWITLARDPNSASAGSLRLPFDISDDVRTNSDDRDGIRVFQATLTVRGFDVSEGPIVERAARVEAIEVVAEQSGPKGEICPLR